MTRYEDMMRRAERLTRAAHRAADPTVSALFFRGAKALENKAREYSIADAEPLAILWCRPVRNGKIYARRRK